MANGLKDRKISTKLRLMTYEATVLSILLFGCESCALKQADRQRLESIHQTCLRAMANITMFDVKEKRIHNEKIREMMGNYYTFHQTMEIRRLRWLEKLAEKLAAMPETRNPRKICISWIPQLRQQEDHAKQSAKHTRIV
eukprot:scaffold535_cov65-Cylindrotheca_fusiformis.AAC.12